MMIFLKKHQTILLLVLMIIIQTIFFIWLGTKKEYIHMDEAYSYGLASYKRVEIQDNDDFYNTWHNGKYYEDYLTVNDNEIGNYQPVYENQKNDMHPPLYYLLLRFGMGFHLNSYTKWTGLIINYIIYIFITVFTFLIINKFFYKMQNRKGITFLLTFTSIMMLSSLTSVLYIRMYALLTLNILITLYLHMQLEDNNKLKTCILIGIMAFFGSLTHYYYLMFLAPLFLFFFIEYIKKKKYQELKNYFLPILFAGMCSIIVFPYSIIHMFFQKKGHGSINNLLSFKEFFSRIGRYLYKINYAFNTLLWLLLIIALIIIIYKKIKKKKILNEQNKYFKYFLYPSIFYFFIVLISSKWIELRYLLPICTILFIMVMCLIYGLCSNLLEEGKNKKVLAFICVLILITPLLYNAFINNSNYLEPEVMYSNKKEIVSLIKSDLNVPTIYFFNIKDNRFLDDILLFSILDESYVTLNIDYNEDTILKILKGKNINRGITIFINDGQDNNKILEIVQKALNLKQVSHIERLNACDVYYLK